MSKPPTVYASLRSIVALGVIGPLLVATTAIAFDVTACGQTVPRGEIGQLQGDLACAPGETAVFLETNAQLLLNGHTLSGGDYSVECVASGGKCTVRGPGVMTGAAVSGFHDRPFNLRRVIISDVTITDTGSGAIRMNGGPRLDLTNVVVERSNLNDNPPGVGSAIGASRIVLRNVTVTDSVSWALGGSIVKGSGLTLDGNGRGIGLARKLKLDGLSITNTAGVAVYVPTGRVVLANSTLANNDSLTAGIDILTGRRPVLKSTTCSRSQVCVPPDVGGGCDFGGPEATWQVCTNDF